MPDEKKELRKIPRNELIQILHDHQKWVESEGEEGEQADLSNTDLKEIDLCDLLPDHKAWLESVGKIGKRANLKYAIFEGAKLKNSSLIWANLHGANFHEAGLFEANLEESDLQGAVLQWADLQKSDLQGADLQGADLQNADLTEANLTGAELAGTNLAESDLYMAELIGVDLRGANLQGAYLQEADLQEANLQGADLRGTDLAGAKLKGCNFKEANLEEAELEMVDLRGAILESTNVTGVKYDRDGRYRGVRVESCYGSAQFKRHAQDQDWLEELLDTREGWWQKTWVWFWRVSSDYGRSFGRWALLSSLLAVCFGCIFYALGPGAFEVAHLPKNPSLWGLVSMIYYSVVTFTTLGFGDIVPKTIPAAILVMAEVILGYIMLGGLISILANKLARRS